MTSSSLSVGGMLRGRRPNSAKKASPQISKVMPGIVEFSVLATQTVANDLRSKRGFSILESIIVLAVTALALTLIYSIGAKATDAAFRLGRHALAASDQQVDLESTREALRAFTIPAADGQEREFGGLRAQTDQMSGPAVLWRDTPCGPAGPVAGLTLALVSDQTSTKVTCSIADRSPVVIGTLPGAGAMLQYFAKDATDWSPSWAPDIGSSLLESEVEAPSRRVLYVRIVDGHGRVYLLERLASGPPHFSSTAM
jgi:prepilin-type N-terminal cleavage/methylation domain-containing protein